MEDEKKAEMLQDYLNDKLVEMFKEEMMKLDKEELIKMLVETLTFNDMRGILQALE